jgi:hypothetical protein
MLRNKNGTAMLAVAVIWATKSHSGVALRWMNPVKDQSTATMQKRHAAAVLTATNIS